MRGALANRALFVLRELLHLLPTWEPIRDTVTRFLEAGFSASSALAGMLAAGDGAAGDTRASIASRHGLPLSFPLACLPAGEAQ